MASRDAPITRDNRLARTSVVWFKVCPVLLSSSAALLIAASLV